MAIWAMLTNGVPIKMVDTTNNGRISIPNFLKKFRQLLASFNFNSAKASYKFLQPLGAFKIQFWFTKLVY